MSKQSITVLTDTGFNLNVTSDPVRADGYFGYKDGLHSISWTLENFTGRIWLEASLASEPQETDWFAVTLDGCNPYVEYPRKPLEPTGPQGDTMVDAYTFQGNFLWVRLRVDRSYVVPQPVTDSEKESLGSVAKALLNH